MSSKITLSSSHKHFGGSTQFYSHESSVCQHKMNFSIYLPPESAQKKMPVVYFLSGLTCNEEIFMTEAQAQAHANRLGLIIVVPDSSPRDTGIEGEDDTYDLGSGASFYVNATTPKWSKHYQMDRYVTEELRQLVENNFPVDPKRQGIFGHSMGGHGALVLGLRNPTLYQSISAFAPICAPSITPWGIKAFSAYLGTDRAAWAKYDAHELIKVAQTKTPILIDQGLEDEFLETELSLDAFEKAAVFTQANVEIRRQPGYDHSYYFISTFVEQHLAFHAMHLNG